MRRILPLTLLLLLALSLVVSPALAQTYLFSLDSQTVHVFWEADGTVTLDYVFIFTNDPSASPIDYVDVGMPNSNYRLSNASADVNGAAITDIQDSEYVSPGIALGLGNNSIPPGQTGQVHFHITGIKRVLYPDDNEPDTYASAVFSPTWFGSQYVRGSTNLTVVYHLPPGVQTEEPRYHIPQAFPGPQEPAASLDEQGRVQYVWSSPNANGYTQYTFGASFPIQYIPEDAVVRPSIFDKMIEAVMAVFDALLPFCCCGGVVAFVVGMPAYSIYAARKRRMKYLPPKISIEGNGIKRGLTAVEAAILMEEPLDKVLTMILFSALKKGAATVKTRDPLELEVAQTLPEELRPYEREFLQAFSEPKEKRKTALQAMMVKLVRGVTDDMKGFSRKESVAYYKEIMNRAWSQVEGANTPEVKSQAFEENMEWTMLDRDFNDRTRDVFRSQPVFLPNWWWRYDPGVGRPTVNTASSSMPSSSQGSGGGFSMPHLPGSDFAASIANGIQGFAGGIIGDVGSFTSGITQVTNPPPPPSRSSGGRSSGGGGHSCACACACAGCACACAGGGR